MRATKFLLPLLLFTMLSGQALAERTLCYHVLEAQCRSETSDEMIGFLAFTWAIPGAERFDMMEICANSYDVQLDFYDYLNKFSEKVPELCRAGVVPLEQVHEIDRAEKKAEANRVYHDAAKGCMANDRMERCVTIEDLDLQQHIGNVRELRKNRQFTRMSSYPAR